MLNHYRQDVFLKFHNFWQSKLYVEDYTAEFDHSMMRCDIVEPKEQMVARYLGGYVPKLVMWFSCSLIGLTTMFVS